LLILRTVVMLLLGSTLVLASALVSDMPCWGVFALIGLLAWPVWLHRTEYRLLHRRLLLESVIRPGSRIRALLWKGTLVRAVQTLAALLLAWLLLALVSQMSAGHGYALVIDAVLLALIICPVTRGLTGSVSAGHRSVVARHWPLVMINSAVLTGVIMWLDFAVVGTIDTRQLAWHQVAVQAFSEPSRPSHGTYQRSLYPACRIFLRSWLAGHSSCCVLQRLRTCLPRCCWASISLSNGGCGDWVTARRAVPSRVPSC
jgi:hypothetical protein